MFLGAGKNEAYEEEEDVVVVVAEFAGVFSSCAFEEEEEAYGHVALHAFPFPSFFIFSSLILHFFR